MLFLVLVIMVCALIGTVLLIGVCAPLSAAIPLTALPRNDQITTAIEEALQDDWYFNAEREESSSRESSGEEPVKTELREGIASRSVPILRARGMTDEKIKSELLRDFALTENQVDKILAAQ